MNDSTSKTIFTAILVLVVVVSVVGASVSLAVATNGQENVKTTSSTPTVYDYVDETGVVTTDGLLTAIDDFRSDDLSASTLLDPVLQSFRTGTPVSTFTAEYQSGSDEIVLTEFTAPVAGPTATDHIVLFDSSDTIVGSVQLNELAAYDESASTIGPTDVAIALDEFTTSDSLAADEYTVRLHADGESGPDPTQPRPGTSDSFTVSTDVLLEFREVNGETTTDPVKEGEELTAYAAIENQRTESTTREIAFRVDDEPVETRTVTLEPGERNQLLFRYQTENGDSPSVNASLALNETETATTTAEVRQSSEFTINIEDITDPVLATGNVTRDLTAEVRVENLGGGTRTLSEDITLSVNGTDTDSQTVTLQDGETTRIDLSGNGSKVTESETSVTAAVDTSGGDSSDRIVTLRGPVKNIDTGETFERLQPAVDGSGEADTVRIDDNLTGGETAANPPPDSTLKPPVDIATDRLTVTTDGAERSINASLSTTEVLNVTGDKVTIDGIDNSLTTIKGNVTITGDNNTIRDVTIVGNLILNGSDTTTSNVDVISGEIVTNVLTTAQAPSDGNIIINGANGAVDGVSTDGDIVIDASDVTVTDSSATNVTVTSNGDNANVNDVDASEFDVDPGATNTETGGSAITAAPGEDLDAKVANAGNSGVSTVRLQAETYTQSVTVDVDGLTLEGAGADATTIVGDGENVGSQPHAAIHVDDSSGPVRNVTIEGFTVENPNGKFGIFAGTGTTKSETDGIGGLVIRDNVVQDVSTQSFGSALTGGPAGIGIRADYGTDGNPGIEISNNEIDNVENLQGGPEPVGITLKSFTGNAGFGFDSTGATVTDTASPPATDTDILNNEISNISSNGGFATKGISVSGEFKDVDIIGNQIETIESPGADARAITLSENGGSYEGNEYDIDGDGNGERIGPQDFDIRNNEISDVTGDARSINLGGYEVFGDHTVSQNTINDGAVTRFAGDQPGYQPGDGDALNLVDNTFTSQTSQLYVSDGSQSADLTTVLNDNTFGTDASVVGDTAIVPTPGAGEAVTETGDVFDGTNAIQNAVDAANAGVLVGPGTFDESVTINTDGLTLEGADGATSTLSSTGSKTVTLQATDITVADVTVTNNDGGNGFDIPTTQNASGLQLDDVTISDTSIAFFNDLPQDGTATDNSEPDFTNIVFTDLTIENSERKGIYTEALSDAVFDNVTIDGVTSDSYGFNSGIDINLKYDDYENITIRDSTVANVSEGDPFRDNPSFSAAIAVKARDDPSSYNSNPATLDDVTIDGVTIEDSFNGLRIGEPGVDYSAAPQGPTDVTITDSTFQGIDGYYVEDVPGELDLSAVLNEQGNTFDPDASVVGDTAIVPTPGEGEAVTEAGEVFDGADAIQEAVDAANAGVLVGPGTFDESVIINTDGLTLEGPNAGLAGDSDARGSEATITEGVDVRASTVTLDGLEVRNPGEQGAADPTDFAGAVGVNIQTTETDVTVENTVLTDIGTNDDDANPIGIYAPDGTSALTVSNNLITDLEGTDEDEGAVQAVLVDESGTAITDVSVTDNTITNLLDTRSTVAVRFNGDVSGSISGNEISGLNTEGTIPGSGGEPGGFTQVIALQKGNASATGPSGVTIEGNDISNIETTTDDNFAPPFHIIIGPNADAGTISIENNDFSADSPDTDVYVRDGTGELDLNAILNDQGNTFDPDGQVSGDGDFIVPEGQQLQQAS